RPGRGWPRGKGDGGVGVGWGQVQGVFQFGDLAGGAYALDAVAGGQDGDAGGVVAAVFEAAEAFNEDGGDVAFSYCADDSAHGLWGPVVSCLLGGRCFWQWVPLGVLGGGSPPSPQPSPARGEGAKNGSEALISLLPGTSSLVSRK